MSDEKQAGKQAGKPEGKSATGATGLLPGEELALRITTLPRDTNGQGTIFGGVILGYIDQAGAIHARHEGFRRMVTVVMREVEFLHPVRVGDVVSFYTSTVRLGRTSVTVKVRVEAEGWMTGKVLPVTTGEAVYVEIDEHGKPTVPTARAQREEGTRA